MNVQNKKLVFLFTVITTLFLCGCRDTERNHLDTEREHIAWLKGVITGNDIQHKIKAGLITNVEQAIIEWKVQEKAFLETLH